MLYKVKSGVQFFLMKAFHQEGKVEIGVDEAGLGVLFGRVYAAAVIWPTHFTHPLIQDSKTLNAKKREEAYKIVIDNAIAYGIAWSEPSLIDQVNIRQANFLAMHQAIDACGYLPDLLLIDGNCFLPYLDRKFEPVATETIVKGDGKYLSIAAASILAKVTRDRYIAEECRKRPILAEYYQIDRNKGYGAAAHCEGIRKYGCQPGHRMVGFASKFLMDVGDVENETGTGETEGCETEATEGCETEATVCGETEATVCGETEAT